MGDFFTTGAEIANTDEFDVGVSKDGAEKFLEAVKANILTDMESVLGGEAAEAVQKALDDGWTGDSKNKFITDLNAAVKAIKEDLEKEYTDLETRVNELANTFYKQDQEMLDN